MSKHGKPVVGVDLGGTNMQVGLVDADGQVLVRDKTKTKAAEGTEAILHRIVATVRRVLEEADLNVREVAALGVGAPGAVDVHKGVVLNAPNLRWSKFPLAEALRDELRLPVTVDNDVNVAAWGEHQAGAGRGFDDMAAVWVGTGIGGGLVLGGELYRGHFSTAGEIGHLVLHADAPLGRRTLENCASRTAVANQLTQLILSNHASKVAGLIDGDFSQIRSRVLSKAVAQEDRLTLEVIGHAARYCGIAVANLVTLLSLPCVVIGGGFVDAIGKSFTEGVREAFETHVFPREMRQCKIVASRLGDDAGVIGAALLARQALVQAASGGAKHKK